MLDVDLNMKGQRDGVHLSKDDPQTPHGVVTETVVSLWQQGCDGRAFLFSFSA